jgi:sec-independent protein translocase protein TatA
MGFASGWHWIILLVVILLLFGNRLPSVMRSLGRGVTEFKKGMDGLQGGDEDEEEEVRPKKKKAVESSNGHETAKKPDAVADEK